MKRRREQRKGEIEGNSDFRGLLIFGSFFFFFFFLPGGFWQLADHPYNLSLKKNYQVFAKKYNYPFPILVTP